MFMILLMPYFVAGEWVEISQNYYRKEPYRNVIHLAETSTENVYKNHSLSEHQWSKGYVDRIPGKMKIQHHRIKPDERTTVYFKRNPFNKHQQYTSTSKTLDLKTNKFNSIETTESYKHDNHFQEQSTLLLRDEKDVSNKNKLITKEKDEKENVVTEKTVMKKIFEPNDRGFKDKKKTPQIADQKNQQESQVVEEENDLKDKRKKANQYKNHAPPNKDKEKSNGFETLIKFMKVVSQTIQKGTKRFNGKIKYLEDLKQSLLANIEERIESVFPDDIENRRRRSFDGEARGHVDFPSSESALMSISFLTFAVFLIKLVLQVIHTYKAKTMMVTPAVVATVGRAGKVVPFRLKSN